MNYIKIATLIIVLLYWSTLRAQEYHLFHQSNETNSLNFEEKGDMPIALSISLAEETLTAFNIQMGYSPLKHLNFSGAYFKDIGNRGSSAERDNSSYTFSVGTNYKITWMGHTVKGKHPNRRKIEKEKGLNFILNLGYSVNNMKFNRLIRDNRNPLHSKTIKYNSFFAKFGFLHEYDWGRWGVFGQINTNIYKELEFNGNWDIDGYLQKVTNYFDGKKTVQVGSLSLHNEIGKKRFKIITGGNAIMFNQFRPEYYNYNPPPSIMVYIGIIIDLSKLKEDRK